MYQFGPRFKKRNTTEMDTARAAEGAEAGEEDGWQYNLRACQHKGIKWAHHQQQAATQPAVACAGRDIAGGVIQHGDKAMTSEYLPVDALSFAYKPQDAVAMLDGPGVSTIILPGLKDLIMREQVAAASSSIRMGHKVPDFVVYMVLEQLSLVAPFSHHLVKSGFGKRIS
ncbi:hypothetical protein VOLCADRAFT_93859 [Volvox carteri f. nagariensis]|uniref:Uncharacterized protein n=1 Tax=Volvox carteri f. nagariensis TaxID=3068 RepID=D8U391_VOLCA|nr:uncharacterized protein VOLCADRAFT_93859 [Volvox carteri f. nagariensis]EFJ45785.1 hypothetical protein VOLCADRAFT_93859 [Volvox carteri f. nagariensis]|eukprot:XP_002953186.1 hypothetical protein VOLCADRAFT_93859 [Volvox carteri f. nagariensis]